MRDNDDLHDIPSMIPARDEVVHHQGKRKQSDIVTPVRYGETVKVSTWPVRIALCLLTVAICAGGLLAYRAYTDNLAALEQANRRLQDLEGRLALVGNSAEETTANVLQRLDFNFAEIDKLWAARNTTNQTVNELTGKLTVLQQDSQGHTETTDTLSQLLAKTNAQVQESLVGVNRTQTEMQTLTRTVGELNASVQGMQNVAQDLANIRASLNNGDSTLVGLQDRMINVEEAVESIDAFRLQVNQAMSRLQQNIEGVRESVSASP